MPMPRRLAVFVTHPIQYFAPIWRRLAEEPNLDIVVHYFSDFSVRGAMDKGFGVNIAWDVPLLHGYEHVFLSRDADLSRPGHVRIPDAASLLRTGKFDAALVLGYMHRFERQVVVAARRRGLRTLMRGEMTDEMPYEGRSRLKTGIRDLYLRWFYRYVDAFCCIGTHAEEHFRRRGIPSNRLYRSSYCVDDSLFERQRQTTDRGQARASLGAAPNDVVIMFSGKFIPRKAPHLLLNAVADLGTTRRVILALIGDGELRGDLRAAAHERLGDRARFPGFVNQSALGAYYAAADIFVLPSEFETWGLVVNEAMQFALPVVASDRCGCVPDLVLSGRTGLVFPAGNRAELTACLSRLVEDNAMRAAMGKAAHAHIGQFTVEGAARGILSALWGRRTDDRIAVGPATSASPG